MIAAVSSAKATATPSKAVPRRLPSTDISATPEPSAPIPTSACVPTASARSVVETSAVSSGAPPRAIG